MTKNIIISKSKNTFKKNTFSMFLFLKNRKQNIKPNIFQNSKFLKMKTIFKK